MGRLSVRLSIADTVLYSRVVCGSIFIDPSQRNPPNNWPNPTHTQPNPLTSNNNWPPKCHHHHPNRHRSNANTHSITCITVILGLFQTDEAVMHQLQVFTKRMCQSIFDTKLHIHDMQFSHICHFSPMTQTNPTKPNPRVNPTHGQLCGGLQESYRATDG